MTTPALPDLCWPVDHSCCADWDSYAVDVQARSDAFATSVLRMLTAYRVGGCPVTIRPCKGTGPCCGQYNWYYGFGGMGGGYYPPWPVLYNGTWFNCACGSYSDCACTQLDYVELPPPVGPVSQVSLDGTVLTADVDWRIDNGNRLVALNGYSWPVCQDMEALAGDPDTFVVSYLNGIAVDGLGAYAAGVMACEYAKACTSGKCRLPSGVTNIIRQGVSMTIAAGSFPGGETGIREVDSWTALYNPYRRKFPVTVYSPDLVQPTYTIPQS
jgi:hypothetical protein